MTRKELQQLRKAVRSVTRPEHMLYFEGKHFSCRWANDRFEWKAPSGTVYNLDTRETLKYIGDGEGIRYFSYDYNDNGNADYNYPQSFNGISAWGFAEYNRPLTEKEISDYELAASQNNPLEYT